MGERIPPTLVAPLLPNDGGMGVDSPPPPSLPAFGSKQRKAPSLPSNA